MDDREANLPMAGSKTSSPFMRSSLAAPRRGRKREWLFNVENHPPIASAGRPLGVSSTKDDGAGREELLSGGRVEEWKRGVGSLSPPPLPAVVGTS